jgi:serine/threonine protein kinase
MEFLEGHTLSSAIAQGPLPVERTADIMLAVCAGVFAAHGAGIIHRDLKPSNIFLCADWNGRATARVLDFGISKVGGVSSSDLTQSGDIVGTSLYLSPEQASGKRHITAASDQYSLGVVMYECVTQRTPQPSGLPMYELLREVAQGRHAPLSTLRPDVPATFAAIIERAMQVRPEERHASVYELGRALFSFAGADCRRQYDDYYRMVPTAEAAQRPGEAARSGEALVAPTLARPEPPIPTWQSQETLTAVRGEPKRRSGRALDVAAPAAPSSHKLAYSVAIGAVVAVAILGGLLLAFRP